jgi:hypothetical protein
MKGAEESEGTDMARALEAESTSNDAGRDGIISFGEEARHGG